MTQTMPTPAIRHGASVGRGAESRRRAAELALMAVLALGSLLLWVGIPAVWLWVWSQASDRYLTIYAAALIGCPLAMAALAWCLHRINRVYLRISEAPDAPRARPGWTRAVGARRARSRGVPQTWSAVPG